MGDTLKLRHLLAPAATLLAIGGLAALPAPAHATTAVTVRVNGIQTYGGSATFTGYTGVKGVTVSGITCTGLTSGAAIDPALTAQGTYTIDGATCSGGVLSDPGYVISKYIGLRHTVNRAPLVVTADNKTREFRDPNPPLTYVVTGFVNGDDASLLTGRPTMATTAKPASQVGNWYNISVSAGSLSAGNNYVLRSFRAGKLTITHKSVVVGVTGVQVYGDAHPTFSGTSGYDGIYVGGITCTKLADGRDIVPTLPAATGLPIDTSTCSGGQITGRNYKIVGYSSVKFNVLKAPLTLTAQPKSRTYGDDNPALTYTASGFVNGDDASVLTGQPSLTTTADATSDVGTYPIDLESGSLAAANYHFSFRDSTLTVGKAALTVSADNATREYGEADPTFTASFSGFRNGDTAASLDGSPSFSTPANTASNAGNYPLFVSAGTLSSRNYAFGGFGGGILTIAPKSVTVAVSGSQAYGDATPSFAGDSGVAGVSVAGVTCTKLADGRDIAPTLPAADGLDVDPSSCSGGLTSSRNYAVGGYSSAGFSVAKALLTVTAEPKSRTYGDTNPVLTYTVTGYKNGDGASALTGTPSLTTSAVPSSNVGSYPIDLEAGTLDAGNYRFAFNDSTLAVTKAVLTATAAPATREHGAPDPAFALVYSGFRNGDTAAVLRGAPTFSTPATASSNPGSYPLFVAPGTLAATNYTFGAFTGNVLTITQAPGNLVTKTMTSDGVLEATLTAGAAQRPVAGVTITFLAGTSSSVACTATTDASGTATCTVTNPGHRNQIESRGYLARFLGNAGVGAVEQRQDA